MKEHSSILPKPLGSSDKCFTVGILIIEVRQCDRSVPKISDWIVSLRLKQSPNLGGLGLSKDHKEAKKSRNSAIPLCVFTSIIVFPDRTASINH